MNPKDEILRQAVVILNGHNIRWWLACGTCLGAVRHRDFIPWDKDIDIGIAPGYTKYWDKLISGFKKEGFKYFKGWTHRGRKIELSFIKNDVKVDLVFFWRGRKHYYHGLFGPNKRGHYKVFLLHRLSAGLFKVLKEVKFKETACYLPSPPEQYLREQYGSEWRLPKGDYVYWRDAKAIVKRVG